MRYVCTSIKVGNQKLLQKWYRDDICIEWRHSRKYQNTKASMVMASRKQVLQLGKSPRRVLLPVLELRVLEPRLRLHEVRKQVRR